MAYMYMCLTNYGLLKTLPSFGSQLTFLPTQVFAAQILTLSSCADTFHGLRILPQGLLHIKAFSFSALGMSCGSGEPFGVSLAKSIYPMAGELEKMVYQGL